MAEEKKIHYDIDLNGNSLKNARVPNTETNNDDDAINRKFVEDKTKYISDLASQPTTEALGGIGKGSTDLENNTLSEILDKALHSVKEPTYEIPTIEAIVSNVDDLVLQTGARVQIVLKGIVDIKDSSGVVTYTFSGDGIDGTITQIEDTFVIQEYYLKDGENKWAVGVNYDESIIKTDSQGNEFTQGSFSSGNVTNEITLLSKFPILYSVDYGFVDKVSNSNDRNFDSFIDIETKEFEVELGNTRDVSFNLGIPNLDYGVRIYMNSIDVTNSFSTDTSQSYTPWENLFYSTEYKFYHWHSNIVLDENTTLKVQIYKKNYDRIVDVIFDTKENTIRLDNGSTLYSVGRPPRPTNQLNISDFDEQTGTRTMTTNLGIIRKIEVGRPHFMVIENMDSTSVPIPSRKGMDSHNYVEDILKYRVWLYTGQQ